MNKKELVEQLENKLDSLKKEVDELWDQSFNMPDGWNWYIRHPKLKELADTNRELKLILTPKLSDFDSLDKKCLMEFDKFKACCSCGALTDDDGSGYYSTKDKISNIAVSPSDIMVNKYRTDFSHVVWYNK